MCHHHRYHHNRDHHHHPDDHYHPDDHHHLQINKATQGGHLSVLLIRLEQRFLDDLVHLSYDEIRQLPYFAKSLFASS